VRLTALNVMTNQPITPAPTIDVLLDWANPVHLTSPGVIPNVNPGTQVFATSSDSSRVVGHIVANAKDIFNDGIMDVTLMLSPLLVLIASLAINLIIFLQLHTCTNEL